jgi:tartrate dehydratase beta subunit/fumarate hydratase class I family protein
MKRVFRIETPIDEGVVKKLRVGDQIEINGVIRWEGMRPAPDC